MKQIVFSILLGTLFLVSSCSKEGPRGPQGVPGVKGEPGSSPQLYYMDIPVNKFKKEVFYDDNSQFYNDAWLAYGYIDGVVMQPNDLVMVFMHQTTDGGPDNYFQALPYTDYFDNTNDFNHYSYGVMDDNGDLVFSIRRNNGTPPFNDMSATWTIQYNIYILKGNNGKKAMMPSSINLSDEKAVRNYLGITERTKVNFVLAE